MNIIADVSEITPFLDPLANCLVMSYLQLASIVGYFYFDPLEVILQFSRGPNYARPCHGKLNLFTQSFTWVGTSQLNQSELQRLDAFQIEGYRRYIYLPRVFPEQLMTNAAVKEPLTNMGSQL